MTAVQPQVCRPPAASAMKPQDDYRNGDGSGEDSGDEEAAALERELSLHDAEAPARALAALDALRKSRQHYDAVLVAGGAEVPAHRAVLAAASPYLLQALAPLPAPAGAAPPAYRVDGVEASALRELLDYAYSGRLRVRDGAAALRLYRAAWRLRVEPARAHLAERLLRRVTPHTCLELRALPGLAGEHLATLDEYIATHFDEVCAAGALSALPLLRIEMLRETSTEGGDEAPRAVADAALAWLRDHTAADVDVSVSRVHLSAYKRPLLDIGLLRMPLERILRHHHPMQSNPCDLENIFSPPSEGVVLCCVVQIVVIT